ncbi:MAG: CHAT domain-containing protein [Deltaproteobacteria bacterium]|nr:CHAT domain-containing protein [Deltaproteobacteria bacterium]
MNSQITGILVLASRARILLFLIFLSLACTGTLCWGQELKIAPDNWPVTEAHAAGASEALKQFSNSSSRALGKKNEPKNKYQWLFQEPESEQPQPEGSSLKLLEKFDEEVREARRLYLTGETENAILKYRNAIDQYEFILDDTPAANPVLSDLEQRFSVFEEIATKILGSISSDIRPQETPRIFHLMEKRRLARRNLAIKKAGLIEPHDVPPMLLKQEDNILNQLLELKSQKDKNSPPVSEDYLRNSLVDLRQKIQQTAPTWNLLRKGLPVTLAEIQTETLKPHELLMDFNLLSDRMVVGLITKEKAFYVQAPVHKSEIDKAIVNLQDKLREYSTGDQSTFMGHAWKEPCRRVFRHLIGKLPRLPREKTTLLIIPDRALWYTPFSLMLDSEDHPFGQGRLISMIPSADILRATRIKDNKQKLKEKNDLLIFESIPWVSEESLREASGGDKSGKKGSTKLTEGQKIQKLILSNSVYPKPSDIVVNVQKLFNNFSVFVGPTATISRFTEVIPRSEKVAILAVPLGVQDSVSVESQPCFYFSPNKTGERRFPIKNLFSIPMSSALTVLPISWFEIRDPENSCGEGPLLMELALIYSGSRLTLINYSDPNWGSEQPFLTNVLKKIASKESPAQALADAPRELPNGMDSSFDGKPPSWSGWLLLGDPNK